MVKTDKGWVLLVSDVGFGRKAWEDGVIPGFVANKEQANTSLQWVRNFAKREDCCAVLANHDPDIQPGVVG
ncbi:hypothetical protein [Paenibacillus arenosi]|uniref:Uncharacterized protein n=1 Tax=Paenibacillus arenosi TaxID=2774142 RepID=A0ABR9ASX4_9BACL|nr:hypothetical protein [Paenibacillus arenosi]MBD8497215.1 hypothetical protein [Paenibacillus arenosi]